MADAVIAAINHARQIYFKQLQFKDKISGQYPMSLKLEDYLLGMSLFAFQIL